MTEPKKEKHTEPLVSQNSPTILQKASSHYNEWYGLRSAVQLIPGVGGALDMLLSGRGANHEARHLRDLIEKLEKRLDGVEVKVDSENPSAEFYEFSANVFRGAAKSASERKRSWYANIFTNQVTIGSEWDIANAYAALLNNLSETDVCILTAVLEIEPVSFSFDFIDEKVVKLPPEGGTDQLDDVPLLTELFPDLRKPEIRIFVLNLVSSGLLQDVGGTSGVRPNVYLGPTDLAHEFRNWVLDEDEKKDKD
ncbi:MAG: hypothetical protein AAFQ83_23205 [Bacteroidota bacterium]